jgi:TetR/AcrR family transcriptional regulator, transcriptional repressor of bet genes
MQSRTHSPKFRRASRTVRREELIEATLACLQKYGHAGVSVRRISAAAGVSPGLINHHFPSITALVAAAYETLATTLLQSIRSHAEQVGAAPRERLRGFFQASFAPNLLNPAIFNAWLVFWSTVSHEPEMRAVHDRTWSAYRATLESMLADLSRSSEAPSFDVRLAAIALSALLDGLWVESSLNPATVTPSEAVSLCEGWIQALCAGVLPGLRREPATSRRNSAPRPIPGSARRQLR